MLGGTTRGFCRREWTLWYGDKEDATPCTLPLTDGEPCGDVFCSQVGNQHDDRDTGKRCPYNRNGLEVDFSQCELTTYAKKRPSGTILATGGAGDHHPEEVS